jgi:hypothetical protein
MQCLKGIRVGVRGIWKNIWKGQDFTNIVYY